MKRNRKKAVTITSVAKHLGVSVATVSYVLNGKVEENGISEATATRVRAAARELGYVPNHLARSLRRQKTGAIGVLLSDLEHGWAHRTLQGMVTVFDPAGYVPYLSVHFWDPEREARELRSLVARRMECIITVPMLENVDEYRAVVDQGVPILFLQDTLDAMSDISYCMWDAREAAKASVRHLLELGRRRIGFVASEHDTPWMRMRYEGYLEALRDAGMPIVEDYICLDPRFIIPTAGASKPDYGVSIRRLFKRTDIEMPDAFLAMNDAMGLTTLHVLKDLDIAVPEEVALIGMGDLQVAEAIHMSSAHEPVEEVGAEAARVVLEMMKSDSRQPIERLVPGSDIVLRDSTEGRVIPAAG